MVDGLSKHLLSGTFEGTDTVYVDINQKKDILFLNEKPEIVPFAEPKPEPKPKKKSRRSRKGKAEKPKTAEDKLTEQAKEVEKAAKDLEDAAKKIKK